MKDLILGKNFDFLRDIVSKVPDLGGSDATSEDRTVAKRRKVVDDDGNNSDGESKRSNTQEAGHNGSSGRGRGRGRESEMKESVPGSTEVPVRNFDLNVDLDENGNSPTLSSVVPSSSPAKPVLELRHEDYPGWSLSDMEKMAIDPIQLANLHGRIDEDEEDYDED
ncbi:Dr1-associated corepressor like [Quillaja saponaria]|uniref:Dr1-associated corepressor like n=1 Tax=Quillaja saponaria TaxID=32244 RepID=A0AAD7PMR6_QUISA|nr:Dr1-associated corepressor like [Quillaja saponaria]